MTFATTRRRLLGGAMLSGLAPLAAACVGPPEPPPPAEPPAPLPILGSVAAQGTVQELSAATRRMVVRTNGGALLDVAPGPEFRGMERLRPGQRIGIEYDAQGAMRLGVPRASDGAGSGRIRGTIRDVLPGGREVTISDRQGVTVTFEVPDRTMMAFLTRLRRGDEVAVTVIDPR